MAATKEYSTMVPRDIERIPQSIVDNGSSEATQSLEGQQQVAQVDDGRNRVFDYNIAKTLFTKLTTDHDARVKLDVDIGRRMRLLDVNVEELQRQGKLESDETYIPMRVIDTNIAREQPAFVSFLTQSRRLMVFQCLDNPQVDTSRLEKEFTTGMRYEGWVTPHFRILDGSQAFGIDYMEVEYNEDKPLHVSLSHVGIDNLLYSRDAENFQACDEVLRRYEVTGHQLNTFVKDYGFDSGQVAIMVNKYKDTEPNHNFIIYKRYCRYNGIIWVSWVSNTDGVTSWLKAPVELHRGKAHLETETVIVDTPMENPLDGSVMVVPTPQQQTRWVQDYETQYPIHPLIYRITEEKKLAASKGRIYLDTPEQEAQTAMWTAMVNGSVRSTDVYASPNTPTGSGVEIEQTDLKLFHGACYNMPLNFWSLPMPNPEIIRVAQQLSVQKQNETGQLDFAVANRKDSRKTATEIRTANQQQQLLSGVQVVLYSMHLQAVYTDAWRIVQSQALQGKIQFMLVPQTQTGALGEPTTVFVNDNSIISLTYKLVPAGETDVIEKAEMIAAIKELLPIAQAVAPELAMKMFEDVIEVTFPTRSQIYLPILQRAGDVKLLISGMFEMLKAIMLGPDGNILPAFAQFAPQIQQLTQKVQPYLAPEQLEQQP